MGVDEYIFLCKKTMRVAMVCLFFTAVIILLVNQVISQQQPQVKLVYLPRSIDQALREEPNALVTFNDMFNAQSVDPSDYSKT